MKRLLLNLAIIAILAMTAACGGGGASGTPDPGSPDPNVSVPDIPGSTGDTTLITVDQYNPTPFGPGENPIGHNKIEVIAGSDRAATTVSVSRAPSFVDVVDRDRAFPVVNGSLNVINTRYNTPKINGNAAGYPWSGGTYPQVTYWDIEGDNANPRWYMNTQADHDNRWCMALEIDPEDPGGNSIKEAGYDAIMTSITGGLS